MNSFTIAGYTGDTDFNMSANGTPICKFSVGVQGWSSKNGKTTMWVPVVAFKDLAERFEKFVKSGSFVVVHGRLEISKWKNKDDQLQTSVALIASDFTLGPKTAKQESRTKSPDPMEESEDDLVRKAVNSIHGASIADELNLDEFDPTLP